MVRQLPSADLIEQHRLWLTAGGFSLHTITDACEVLYQVDRALYPYGLAAALPEELTGWLAFKKVTCRQHIRRFFLWATDPTNPILDYDPTMPEDVRDHLMFCEGRGMSPRTVTDRGEVLCRVNQDVGPLGSLDAQRILSWFRPRWKPQTRATYLNHLRGFYRWRLEVGRSQVDPLAKVPAVRIPPTPPREPASQSLVDALVATAPEPFPTCALLAAYGGLRCIEVARLTRANVSEEFITVHGKGNRLDLVPTHRRIWAHLRDFPPGPVVTRNGRPMAERALSVGFAGYVHRHHPDAAHATMHNLRHLFTQRLRLAGVDVRVIQTLMRHSSLATTQRYMHVEESERSGAIAALN